MLVVRKVNQLELANMAEQVNVHDAKSRLSELLVRVENGEAITIARAGRPVARLVPIDRSTPRTLGFASGRLDESFFEPLPQSELDAWQNPR